MSDTLVADHVLQFDYTRSTGPVVGAFLTGLRDGRVLGIRTASGRVVVPPQEYDPDISAELTPDDLVEVAAVGTVRSWTWNPAPRRGQPLDRPFAWVLVRLDGADTDLLHALHVDGPDEVEVGMRVALAWADEPVGAITDLAGFVPGEEPRNVPTPSDAEPIDLVVTPHHLALVHHASPNEEAFLRGTQERRLLGRRCERCEKVYLPPRGVCSMCGAAFTDEIVEVDQVGTVATFAVVNVPFANQEVEIPYAAVEVLWDGAHITSQYLFRGAPLEEVRMGMRVRAVWAEGDLQPTLSNVTHVEPVDEPDTPFEKFAEYV